MNPAFLCPKPAAPSGGVWFIHKVVGLLREMGKEAVVVQMEPFELWWDANPISSRFIKTISPLLALKHTLVMPETMIHQLVRGSQERPMCFLQNHIWAATIPEDIETICCSRYLINYTLDKYPPQRRIWKVTPYLEDGVWFDKEKIANKVLLYSRRSAHSESLKNELELNGFRVDFVNEPLTQRQAAERLADSEYYVHTSYPEGFPMACLEAMRSKALVVGTTGGGGNEFMFHRETALCVQDPQFGKYDSDTGEFNRRIIEQILIAKDNAQERKRIVDTAFDWSRRYTATETKKELEAIGF